MYLQTIARIVAGNLGVRVVFSDSVETFMITRLDNGEMVILMAKTVLKALEGKADLVETVTRGAIAHEALGHGYHTDFSLDAKTPYGRDLANALEDIRIERLAPDLYPGARISLREMVLALDSEMAFFTPEDDCRPEEALLIGLLRRFRTKVLRQPLPADVTDRLIAKAKDWLGVDLFTRIEAIAQAACLSSTTGPVVKAADDIVDLLRQAIKPQSPQQQAGDPQQGQGAGTGEQQQGQSTGQQAGDPQQGQGAGTGEQQQGQSTGQQAGDPQQGQGTGTGEQQQGQSTGQQAGDPQQGQGTGTGEQQQGQSTGRGRGSSPDALAFDPTLHFDVAIETAAKKAFANNVTPEPGLTVNPTDIRDQVPTFPALPMGSEVKGIIQKMRSNLETALRSITDDEDDVEDDSGRLDTGRLARTAAGFEQRPFLVDGKPGRGLSTELVVLFDCSSSMDDLGEAFLRQLVFASGSTLGHFAPDVRFNMAFFHGNSILAHTGDKHWTPEHGAKVSFAYRVNGGTNWARSALPLIPLLANSRKERKVLLTVSDGDINASKHPALLDELRKYGAEMCFVCINHAVPHGLHGISCEAKPASFATAFANALLTSISPEFA